MLPARVGLETACTSFPVMASAEVISLAVAITSAIACGSRRLRLACAVNGSQTARLHFDSAPIVFDIVMTVYLHRARMHAVD